MARNNKPVHESQTTPSANLLISRWQHMIGGAVADF
jgi:hypothetical protein